MMASHAMWLRSERGQGLQIQTAGTLNNETLSRLQRHSFDYFVNEVDPTTGLTLDKTAANWPASIAAMGLGLTAYLVGSERKFISREEAAQRTLATLRFLASSEQSQAPDATGYKGFYYHFLNVRTGRREWQSELSSIDTALLIAGALAAGEYFDRPQSIEGEIRQLAKFLYERIDWAWMLAGRDTVCHGWGPEKGFLPFHWEGYDEALILYLLALGSPTHPIPARCYDAWCSSYEWKEIYGIEFLYAGPLFIHQMSHIWCDFRGVRDRFMRQHDCDYFENSRRATLVQQQYAIRNPLGFEHYGQWCWGITASDGPGQLTQKVDGIDRTFFDYVARGVPFGPDDGTIAPWAVAASLPFAPEIVEPTIAKLAALHVRASDPYGFKASFNPAFHDVGSESPLGWVSKHHFGINEGPTVLMIENYRTGLIWSLMRRCRYLDVGMRIAGFSGERLTVR
jgi:hypothetical protein